MMVMLVINLLERILFYIIIAAVQVIILPLQTLYSFKMPWPINVRPFKFLDKVIELFNDITEGKKPFDFSIWRILLLGKWYEMIATNK